MLPMSGDYSLQLAQKHVDAFDALMEQHRQAMKCRDCEELLQSGIDAYRWLTRADETIRQAAIEGFDVPPEVVTALATMYRAWFKPCRYAEERIRDQERQGFAVTNVDAFRKAHDAMRMKVHILEMEDHLESAFQGGVFDVPFWTEAQRLRNT